MPIRLLMLILRVLCLFFLPFLTIELPAQEENEAELIEGKPLIRKLPSPRQGGSGYELVYVVDVPVDIFWKFKTDFDNTFLTTNKFIIAHRIISRHDNVVVTEDVFSKDLYTHKPNTKFRWQTTIFPDAYRLDFVLLNPAECGQKFHHGSIQLNSAGSGGQKTQVSQRAYFDFFGVSFWVNYPWYGGMKYFLTYSVEWEQATIQRLKSKYIQKSAQ
ncbi:MAG: hypothetical protein JRE62_12150 [Deltaproteobacteria bacterium]|nr:hypothetical protein [Deltaproteobacteria bacterium]